MRLDDHALNDFRHIPRKRFGQHWLKDQGVLDQIVKAAKLSSDDCVLEVGPGKGALTEKLIESQARFIQAIELDRDLIVGLKRRFSYQQKFSLREGDVLSAPLEAENGLTINKVVANIPYNITGPLLERLLGRLDRPSKTTYKRLILLLQKEVADRILASPGQSNFSALSVRVQLMAKCNHVCSVSPNSFKPPPKVDSTVIAIEPFSRSQCLESSTAIRVEELLRKAFSSRRKKLRNTLVGLISLDKLAPLAREAGINLNQRPQEISPGAWVQLAKGLNLFEKS